MHVSPGAGTMEDSSRRGENICKVPGVGRSRAHAQNNRILRIITDGVVLSVINVLSECASSVHAGQSTACKIRMESLYVSLNVKYMCYYSMRSLKHDRLIDKIT